jgi:hypothetical protein
MAVKVARLLAAAVAVVIIGVIAHSAVVSSGGYTAPVAPQVLALAAGLIAGSMTVGIAWREGRFVLAALLVLALVAGEAWALLRTAERVVAVREKQQAPLRSTATARAAAEKEIADAEAALAAARTTPRLAHATKAKAVADMAVIAKASEPGCASNCRQLLQAQVDQAAAEVKAARAEVEAGTAAAAQRLALAHAGLTASAPPESATPLADRLGLPGWKLDLTEAGLVSVALNGLGALLLFFAAHGWRRPAIEASAATLLPIDVSPRDAASEADLFARSVFLPKKDGQVRVAEIKQRYGAWCERQGMDPLPDHDIGRALSALFSKVGLYRRGRGANAVITGIGWRGREPVLLQ